MSSPPASKVSAVKRHKKTSDPARSSSYQSTATNSYGGMLALQGSAGNRGVNTLVGSLGGGAPLPLEMRDEMEQRFGEDFSRVRVHTDARAAQSAAELSAKAYTFGNNIVFNEGWFSPESTNGKWLLAHELAHVVQQGRSGSSRPTQNGLGLLEQAASDAAASFTNGVGRFAVRGDSAVGIACEPDDDLRRRQEEELRYESDSKREKKSETVRDRKESIEREQARDYAQRGIKETGSDRAKKELLEMLEKAEAGEFSALNPNNKLKLLKRFKDILKDANQTDLPKLKNKLQGDFDEALRTPRSGILGKPQSKIVSGSPELSIHDLPPQKGGYAQPDYSVQIKFESGGAVRANVNLKSHNLEGATLSEGRAIANETIKQAIKNVFGDKNKRGSLGHLPEHEPLIISFAETPSKEVQKEINKILFRKDSPITEVRFGDTTHRRPLVSAGSTKQTPTSAKATPIKGAPVLVGSPDEGYHLESQPASPEKPQQTGSKSAKNPPQPASPPPPMPSTKALPKAAAPASIEKTAPNPPSTPNVPAKAVKPPQTPKAVLTAPAKESAPTNPSVLKPAPPRQPSAAPHPAEVNSLPKAKPPAASAPPPSATLLKGPNNTFNPWSDRRLQKWNEGAIRKTDEYVKNRQNRSSAKEAGAALLGEMLGEASENLNEWGIQRRTEEELAKLKPMLKAYQEAHPTDGVLIAVQIETWDPNWRPSDARPTRSFVSVAPQFGGKTKDEAMDRWSTEPKLLPGPSVGSRMGTDFIWIPPGQYVSLSKTNLINGRYVSNSDPTRMLIFQFEDNGTFHCDAVDPRSGGRLRVEVVRGWQLNLNENSLKMTAKFYDLESKAVIESEFMVLDSEWVQEHWSSDTGRSGDIFWQKSQF